MEIYLEKYPNKNAKHAFEDFQVPKIIQLLTYKKIKIHTAMVPYVSTYYWYRHNVCNNFPTFAIIRHKSLW